MPIRASQFLFALIVTLGLAACEGLPAQPAPVGGAESSPTSPVLHEPSPQQLAPAVAPESPLSDQADRTPPTRALSTPALIEQALTQGEITIGQRLLYLAYAVYEYESLPAQFQSDVGWRGTGVVGELRQAADTPNIMCSLEPDVQSEFRRVLKGGATCD